MKTFILHDETVNTYGFRMLTSGADLSAFRSNPVMLYNHNDWEMPIGRWVNVRVEGTQILAEADFDMGDKRASEIARKVEAGYISACSVGAWVKECSSDPITYLEGQTEPTVTRWSLREASICNIPANHNALALYDADGRRVEEVDYSTILQLTDTIPTHSSNTSMTKKINALLSLSDDATEEKVLETLSDKLEKLEQVETRLSALLEEKKEREAAEAQARMEHFETLTSRALKDGVLTEEQSKSLRKLYDTAPEEALHFAELLPHRPSVAKRLTDRQADERRDKSLAALSWDELDRSGRLAELRSTDPDAYAEKYKEKFGTNN